jgi:hypothetical protein
MSFAVPCLQVDQGDVILVFAYSHIVATVLCTAAREGKRFRVAVVDARPESEGRLMLKVGSNAYQHAVGVPHATNTRGVELRGGVGGAVGALQFTNTWTESLRGQTTTHAVLRRGRMMLLSAGFCCVFRAAKGMQCCRTSAG